MLGAMSREIGRKLVELRESRGLTQEGLAAKVGKRRPASISHWETGERTPTKANLKKLAKALGVTVEALDPRGEAYDPERPRPRKNSSAVVQPVDNTVAQPTPTRAPHLRPGESGVSEDHQALLRRLTSAYGNIEHLPPHRREDFVDRVTELAHDIWSAWRLEAEQEKKKATGK
jgi:transcriptional regulator with XRE-family HTH domain